MKWEFQNNTALIWVTKFYRPLSICDLPLQDTEPDFPLEIHLPLEVFFRKLSLSKSPALKSYTFLKLLKGGRKTNKCYRELWDIATHIRLSTSGEVTTPHLQQGCVLWWDLYIPAHCRFQIHYIQDVIAWLAKAESAEKVAEGFHVVSKTQLSNTVFSPLQNTTECLFLIPWPLCLKSLSTVITMSLLVIYPDFLRQFIYFVEWRENCLIREDRFVWFCFLKIYFDLPVLSFPLSFRW